MSAVVVKSRGMLVPVDVWSCLRVAFLCKAELTDTDVARGINAVVNGNWLLDLQSGLFPALKNIPISIASELSAAMRSWPSAGIRVQVSSRCTLQES